MPFISECFHGKKDSQWLEKVSWRYQTRNSQNGPNVFLSSFFRRASSILRQPLAGSVPVFLDPPRPDGGSRARLAVYLACWAWAVEEAELRRVCVVLSIEPGTWKDWGRSLSLIWIYLNDWVIIHAFWMPGSIYAYPRSLDREDWICHPSREGLTRYSWASDSSANTASVANTWVNCPYISGCLWQTSAAVWWQTSAQACAEAAKK